MPKTRLARAKTKSANRLCLMSEIAEAIYGTRAALQQ